MMSTDPKRYIHVVLERELSKIGFATYEQLVFGRFVGSCTQLISLGGRVEGCKFKFSCTLGIRFNEIEALLRPENSDATYPTVSCPIHLLRPDRKFYEFEGESANDLEVAVADLLEEIYEVGLAFYNKFVTVDDIFGELSSSAVSKWFVLSSHQKVGTLAAIAILRGDRLAAERIISEALSDSRNQNAGRQQRIAELHQVLLRAYPTT